MEQREQTVRLWFDMWRKKKDTGIGEVFSPHAVYIESWGPEYHGTDKIRHWFEEWNSRATVLCWDIKQFFHCEEQTIVEWYFQSVQSGGSPEAFDGMTLIRWAPDEKIAFLQEFGCNLKRYDPYANGPEPEFQCEQAPWF